MFTCRGCNKRFTPKRKIQPYHNRACFLESTIVLVTCPECGIKFQKKRTDQVCCSPKCANPYRAKKNTKGVTIICNLPGCDNQVHIMPSRKRKHNFCSREHQILYLQSKKNVDMSKEWHHTLEAREKIRQANLSRDYNISFTVETRQKLAEGARKKKWTNKAKEKLRKANLGKKLSEEHKKKIKAKAKHGKDSPSYKGDEAGYVAKHLRLAIKRKDQPKVCAKYKTEPELCKGPLQNSNKDHKYSDNPNDWEWLCKSHHDQYHWQYGLVKPTRKTMRFYRKFGNLHMRGFTVDGIIVEANTPEQNLSKESITIA